MVFVVKSMQIISSPLIHYSMITAGKRKGGPVTYFGEGHFGRSGLGPFMGNLHSYMLYLTNKDVYLWFYMLAKGHQDGGRLMTVHIHSFPSKTMSLAPLSDFPPSHYPDTELTNPCPILVMNARLGSVNFDSAGIRTPDLSHIYTYNVDRMQRANRQEHGLPMRKVRGSNHMVRIIIYIYL